MHRDAPTHTHGSHPQRSPSAPHRRPPRPYHLQLEGDGSLHVRSGQAPAMAAAVGRAAAALADGRYLHLPYTTLFEYLTVRAGGGVSDREGRGERQVKSWRWQMGSRRCRHARRPRCSVGFHWPPPPPPPPPGVCGVFQTRPTHLPQYLRAISAALEPCGPAVLFYLAAAVSDFFMPWEDMVRVGGRGGRGRRLMNGQRCALVETNKGAEVAGSMLLRHQPVGPFAAPSLGHVHPALAPACPVLPPAHCAAAPLPSPGGAQDPVHWGPPHAHAVQGRGQVRREAAVLR